MYQLFTNEQFASGFTVRQENGIDIVKIGAKAKGDAAKLELKLVWETENIGVNLTWSPTGYRNKTVRPDWGASSNSSAMSGAPVFCNVAYDDTNRMTIACADAKNSVRISSGVVEETARLKNSVIINVDCAIDTYSTEVLVDTRAIPFYKCVDNVAAWWEEHDGYKPMEVPDDARRPLYSAWYSFHQQVDVPRIVDECRYFADLGCKVLIVDDGWQTSDNSRGYAYCGDWQPASEKVPDMKAFVDAVHSTGLKFMLWYSVPFVGIHSAAYQRFSDKTLYMNNGLNAAVLDPRYPDVRGYLIDIYRRAALDWGLDGFKLDFIDSFRQSADLRDGMDYVSVYDAVYRLMKDVMYELKRLNPDILIEFRQSYMGPLMRTFGNMIRSGDCPCDSNTNKLNILALRMTGRGTATHSDMVMWNYSEPVELAAFQLTNVLFSVPQISVLHDRMPDDHAKMVKNYLGFFTKYRDVLLDGEMMYKNYAADFTYVSSRLGDTQVGAVYSGRFAYLDEPTDNIVIVNASLEHEVLLDAKFDGLYEYRTYDCVGDELTRGKVMLGEFARLSLPVNGRVELARVK